MGKSDRPYLYITDGCLDARDIRFKHLPPGVILCGLCEGNGKYKQRYIEGSMTGACEHCKTAGFVYEHNSRPVPISVTNQIAVANGLVFESCGIYGLDWRKETKSARTR